MEMAAHRPLLALDAGSAQAANEEAWQDDRLNPLGASKIGGSDSSQRFVLLALWLGFILTGYLVARVETFLGLPYDGVTDADAYDTFDDISKMLQFGSLLFIFVRVMDIERFRYLFIRSRWYFVPTFLGTPPVYSLISNCPAFRHSLADISKWGVGMWTLEIVAVSAALTSVVWHAHTAWQSKSRSAFIAYVVSRTSVVVFYAGAGVLLSTFGSRYTALHVHHLYLGWCVASWAEFDHPVSVVTLALGLGIFVQGIGAFSFASNWSDPSCFSTRPAGNLTCSFWSAGPGRFSLDVCPGESGDLPRHHCVAGL